MTNDFMRAAREAKPQVLLSEGTRVSEGDSKKAMSEMDVLDETLKVVGKSRRLVLSSFKGNDVDRINTFSEAAAKTGRRLLVSMKTALLLEMLARDSGITVPKVGRDVLVYIKRKKSGRIDDKDYLKWERPFLDQGSTAEDVRGAQGKLFLHLEAWNLPEVIDIKPERGGVYVHSSTEAFNEEGEREEDTVKNWVEHLGFSYHQIHASGHAPGDGVRRMVSGVGARIVVPVHTERPELFSEFTDGKVVQPVKARPIKVER
jgi:ribonuclease J